MQKQTSMFAQELYVCLECVRMFCRISSNAEYYGVKGCYELQLGIRGSQQGAGL